MTRLLPVPLVESITQPAVGDPAVLLMVRRSMEQSKQVPVKRKLSVEPLVLVMVLEACPAPMRWTPGCWMLMREETTQFTEAGTRTVTLPELKLRAFWKAVVSSVEPSHKAPNDRTSTCLAIVASIMSVTPTTEVVPLETATWPSVPGPTPVPAPTAPWTKAVEAQALVLSPTGRVGQVEFWAKAGLASNRNGMSQKDFHHT